jgi:hypothetical protein
MMKKYQFRAYFEGEPNVVWDVVGDMVQTIEGFEEVEMVHFQDSNHAKYIARMYREIGKRGKLMIELLDNQGKTVSAYRVTARLTRYKPSSLNADSNDVSQHTLWITPETVEEVVR